MEYCKGLVRVLKAMKEDTSWNGLVTESLVLSSFELEAVLYSIYVHPDEMFKDLQVVGIIYGPAFRNLIVLAAGLNRSVVTFSIVNTVALMPGQYEYGYIIYSITLDSLI